MCKRSLVHRDANNFSYSPGKRFFTACTVHALDSVLSPDGVWIQTQLLDEYALFHGPLPVERLGWWSEAAALFNTIAHRIGRERGSFWAETECPPTTVSNPLESGLAFKRWGSPSGFRQSSSFTRASNFKLLPATFSLKCHPEAPPSLLRCTTGFTGR